MVPGDDPPRAATEHWALWSQTEPDWAWPDGKDVAVCLSFDVDAETAFFSRGQEYYERLSSLSEGRFSVVRGVPRMLALLRRHGLPATFFVPGWTAENYPHTVDAILNDGHEVGHHGYLHARTNKVSAQVQAEELDRGLAALESVGAPRPRGYRSPAWEVTPETFELLVDAGFLYDSSFMSDDRPYVERLGGLELLELPVHWGLDDWPYFGFSADRGGNVSVARDWRANWWTEYEHARDEGRQVTYTCHPEVSGRAYRAVELERFIEQVVADDRAWIATMEDVARHVEPKLRVRRGS